MWSGVGAAPGPLLPPLGRHPDLPLGGRAEGRDHRGFALAENQRDVPPLAGAEDGASTDSAPIGRERERQIGAQDEHRVAVLVVNAEGAAVAEAWRRTGVVRPRIAHELDLHLAAAKRTGATLEEIKEAILHVAVYAGVPAANRAMSRVKQIYDGGEVG